MEGNNITKLTNGMRVTFTHPKLGRMTGTIDTEDGSPLFLPDDKFNDELYTKHGVEGESGLYLTGADVAPL